MNAEYAIDDTEQSSQGAGLDRSRLLAMCEALMLASVRQHESADFAEQKGQDLRLAICESEHRAKNSLQTVASMLNVQLRKNSPTVSINELAKIQMHVQTIASMHDLLLNVAQSVPSSKKILAAEMLHRLLPLCQNLVGQANLHWHFDEIELTIKQCASLATVVNELICNAMKHEARSVTLRLAKRNQRAFLRVSDNGTGFADGFKLTETSSFGLRFVESVMRTDFGGKVFFTNLHAGGARVTVVFPLL